MKVLTSFILIVFVLIGGNTVCAPLFSNDNWAKNKKTIKALGIISKNDVRRLVKSSRSCRMSLYNVVMKKNKPIIAMPLFDIQSNRAAIRRVANVVLKRCG